MNQKTKKINQYEPRDKAIEIIAKELNISPKKAKEMIESHKPKSGTMHKSELVEEIAQRAYLQADVVEQVVDTMADVISEAIYRHRRDIKIRGFMSIKVGLKKLSGALSGVAIFTKVSFSRKLKEIKE
jgi:nucleoid DNA-binding protein